MFFTNNIHLPLSSGFSLFSFPHLCMLAVITLICVIAARRFRVCRISTQQHITHALGITILLLEIVRTLCYHRMGCMNIYELPLHLCGMAVFLCAIHSLWSVDWLGQVLYTLCLPGACAALLFPDWVDYPFFGFISLHSFIAHGCIVLYIVLQTAGGYIRPRLSAIWKPVLFLCVVVPPVMLFDQHFHANYMFLQLPSVGSPLVFLSQLSGGNHIGYLILFAIVIFLVMVLMDLSFSFSQQRRHK